MLLTDRKDLTTFWLAALALLMPAAVLAVSGDAPHVFIMVAGGLGVSLAKRRPLPRTTRSYVYSVVIVAVLVVLGDQVFPIDPLRFFLLPAHFYGPLFLGLGVAATFFDQREHTLTALASLAVLAAMLAGNVVTTFPANPRFPVAMPLLREFPLFFGVATALQLAALALLLARTGWFSEAASAAGAGRRFHWRRRVIVAACLALVVGGSAVLRLAGQYYERRMQIVFAGFYQKYLSRREGWQVFPARETDLWRTVGLRRAQDNQVIIHARADKAPGYLRGRVYREYQNGRWLPGPSTQRTVASASPGGRFTFKIFRRPIRSQHEPRPGLQKLARIDIFPTPQFRSDLLYAPGNVSSIEMIADGLRNDDDGVLRPLELDQDGGYTLRPGAGLNPTAFQAPGPRLTDEELATLLQIPEDLRAQLREIAAAALAAPPGDATFDYRLACLQNWLQRHFEYSLDLRLEPGADPIIQFLTKYRHGHCEFFAAAGVLLLRSLGIPARYVTGIVCAEGGRDGNYWLARKKDMHAWVEAFDPATGNWHWLDPTPGAGRPQPRTEMGLARIAGNSLALFWRAILAEAKRGYVAEAIITFFAGAGKLFWWFFWHPVRSPALVVIVSLLVWGGRRLRKHHGRGGASALHPARQELQGCLRLIEKRLSHMGCVRQPQWTVRELGAHLAAAPQATAGAAWRELLLEYENLRYRGDPPTPATIAAFREKVRRQAAAGRG